MSVQTFSDWIIASDLTVIFRICGIAGFFCYMVSFFLLQIGRLYSDQIAYSALNVAAPLLVMVSLIYEFNLASAMIQFAWVIIAILGIYMRLMRRKSLKPQVEAQNA